MARIFNEKTLAILQELSGHSGIAFGDLYHKKFKSLFSYKDFYNTLYRLSDLGLLERTQDNGKLAAQITSDGKKILSRLLPVRDGVWKLVIFDVPEKQKYVRTVLRAKLKSLHFKKWQNSIWISPYALDEEIEQELSQLSKKFFVRLIKTTSINNTDDLEKLFPKE